MAEGASPQQISLPLVDPGNHALGLDAHPDLHAQIFSILKEYLQPENHKGFTSDALQAAKRVADVVPILGENEGAWAEMAMYLGFHIYGLAQQIPHHHPSQERLVQLHRRLGTCNKMMVEFNYGPGIKKTWNDRTIMLDFWRNFDECIRNLTRMGWRTNGPRKMINGHAFLARLMGAGYFMGDIYDTIYLLRDYLEEPLDGDASYQAAVISCMSMWVIYGGQELFNRIVLNIYKQKSPNPNHFRPGKLFDGPDLRLGRWRFWQRRLATFEPNDTNAEAVDLATRASDLMLAIEKAMTFG